MISQPPGFFRQNREGVERPSTWRGRRTWLVSRSMCRFRQFRLPDAQRTDLKNFAAVKAREWAPYAEVGFHLHLTGDAVCLWAWDDARVKDAMNGVGVNRARVAVLPETALQERLPDGLHLVRCSEGFDGQFWSDGELTASRWWAQSPSREQWIEFQRGTAVQPLGDAPPTEVPPQRKRRWTDSGDGLSFGIERRRREMIVVGLALLLAGYGYIGGALARHAIAVGDLRNRLEQAEHQSAPVLADRERASANIEFLDNFNKLNPYPPQLALFARVAEKLPLNGAQITAWSYQRGELQFTVSSPSAVDILFYVKTYSAVDGFTEVTATNGGNPQTLRVKLHLAKS